MITDTSGPYIPSSRSHQPSSSSSTRFVETNPDHHNISASIKEKDGDKHEQSRHPIVSLEKPKDLNQRSKSELGANRFQSLREFEKMVRSTSRHTYKHTIDPNTKPLPRVVLVALQVSFLLLLLFFYRKLSFCSGYFFYCY